MIDLINPPLFRFHGDEFAGKKYMGRGAELMRTLESRMASSRFNEYLKQDSLQLRPAPGVVIIARKIFGLRFVHIIVEPKRAEREVKKLVKFIKVFVHVDMINQETWQSEWVNTEDPSTPDSYFPVLDSGDILTRDMVKSAVACGVLNLADGSVVWEDVKIPGRTPLGGEDTSTEWLAEDDLPPWEGIYDGDDHLDTTLGYYNELFKLSPFYRPVTEYVPTEQWMSTTDRSKELSQVVSELLADGDQTTYSDWTTLVSNAGQSGWDHDDILTYNATSWPGTDAVGTMRIVSCDAMKLTQETQQPGTELDGFLHGAHGTYTISTFNGLTGSERDKACYPSKYEVAFSPILGLCWCYPSTYLAGLSWDDDDTCCLYDDVSGECFSMPMKIYYQEFYLVREMLKTANNNTSSSWPYNYKRQLPFRDTLNYHDSQILNDHDFLYCSNNGLGNNYALSNGFSWYCNIWGGVFSKLNRTRPPKCTPAYDGYGDVSDDYEFVRSLISFSAIGGYNPPPWGETGKFNASLKHLAGSAIQFLGGSVYPNEELPTPIPMDDYNRLVNYHGIQGDYRFFLSPGLLYASPLFNVKVYCLPVDHQAVVSQ